MLPTRKTVPDLWEALLELASSSHDQALETQMLRMFNYANKKHGTFRLFQKTLATIEHLRNINPNEALHMRDCTNHRGAHLWAS